MLTVDLKIVEDAHPPENQATESNWEPKSVVSYKRENMQRTGHGERETGVRGREAFTRHVDEVSGEACSEQSTKEVNPQADPSAAGSAQARSSVCIAEAT